MRIIGGRDYYDSALAYGQDDDVVFVRDEKEFSNNNCPLYSGYPHDLLANHHWSKPAIEIRDPVRGPILLDLLPVSIYVAGTHQGGIKVREQTSGAKVEVFWDYSKFEKWVASYGKSIGTPNRYKWQTNTPEMDAFPNLRAFMAPRLASPEQLTWLIDNRVVTAIWCNHTLESYYRRKPVMWHCNSSNKAWMLTEYDFQKAMDPFSMFQEISMFVSGVLPRNPNPMVEITDDKVKVAKHGFDKWSFRKHRDDA